MSNILKLMPAYGVRIASQDDLLHLWDSGKDFYSPETRYCSKRDINLLESEYARIDLVGFEEDCDTMHVIILHEDWSKVWA